MVMSTLSETVEELCPRVGAMNVEQLSEAHFTDFRMITDTPLRWMDPVPETISGCRTDSDIELQTITYNYTQRGILPIIYFLCLFYIFTF